MQEYVYGEKPNVFFVEQLDKSKNGTIVLPCEGEGRNAVYAAAQGWVVNAFDTSEAGIAKAMQLANKNGVTIEYALEDAAVVEFPNTSVDVVAFIFAHFPPATRQLIHQKAIRWLKPGGKIILEAFNPAQLQNSSGGPKEVSMLYTGEILRQDFEELNIELLQTLQTTLDEGKYHQGKADIIRFVGTKS